LIEKARAGDMRAVSRLITLIENDQLAASRFLPQLGSASNAAVIGITGYPGAGKSTLIDQLVRAYRR
jgi:LAO/AO transport system kinase